MRVPLQYRKPMVQYPKEVFSHPTKSFLNIDAKSEKCMFDASDPISMQHVNNANTLRSLNLCKTNFLPNMPRQKKNMFTQLPGRPFQP